jgi:thioredoxin 2
VNDRPICGRCGNLLDELIVQCIECGTKNRVPEDRLNDRALCSKCGVPLYQGSVSIISDESFSTEVTAYPGPAIVCFYSTGSESSRKALSEIEQIASKYAGGVKIARMNAETNPRTISEYKIEKIPSFLFFKNGNPLGKPEEILSKKEIEARLRSIIKDE